MDNEEQGAPLNWQPYHSALSQCAELLDTMQEGDSILDVPRFLARKLAQSQSPVPRVGGSTSIEGLTRWGFADIDGDFENFVAQPGGEYVKFADVERLISAGSTAASQSQAAQPTEHWTPAEQAAFSAWAITEFPNESSQGLISLGSAWKQGQHFAYIAGTSQATKAQAEPVAWMRDSRKECTTAESKAWMENAGFGHWPSIAKEYTIPLYAAPVAKEAPIQMILHCPACGKQHVDAPDERTEGWVNPPHRSHLCHGCGHIWRPADVPTEGVKAIQTRGKNDGSVASVAKEVTRDAETTEKAKPELIVWYGPMPESNGKSNFTATLMRKGASMFDTDSYTFARSEYPDRVRYEADFMSYLIGERVERPEMWDKGYDFKKHSGYVAPATREAKDEQQANAAPAGQQDADERAFNTLYGSVMNIPVSDKVKDELEGAPKGFYLLGHRDARHAAADLITEFASGFREGRNTKPESAESSDVATTTSTVSAPLGYVSEDAVATLSAGSGVLTAIIPRAINGADRAIYLGAQKAPEEVRNHALTEILSVGGQMANVMYNLAQAEGRPLERRTCETMDSLRKQWDALKRTTSTDTGSAA